MIVIYILSSLILFLSICLIVLRVELYYQNRLSKISKEMVKFISSKKGLLKLIKRNMPLIYDNEIKDYLTNLFGMMEKLNETRRNDLRFMLNEINQEQSIYIGTPAQILPEAAAPPEAEAQILPEVAAPPEAEAPEVAAPPTETVNPPPVLYQD